MITIDDVCKWALAQTNGCVDTEDPLIKDPLFPALLRVAIHQLDLPVLYDYWIQNFKDALVKQCKYHPKQDMEWISVLELFAEHNMFYAIKSKTLYTDAEVYGIQTEPKGLADYNYMSNYNTTRYFYILTTSQLLISFHTYEISKYSDILLLDSTRTEVSPIKSEALLHLLSGYSQSSWISDDEVICLDDLNTFFKLLEHPVIGLNELLKIVNTSEFKQMLQHRNLEDSIIIPQLLSSKLSMPLEYIKSRYILACGLGMTIEESIPFYYQLPDNVEISLPSSII